MLCLAAGATSVEAVRNALNTWQTAVKQASKLSVERPEHAQKAAVATDSSSQSGSAPVEPATREASRGARPAPPAEAAAAPVAAAAGPPPQRPPVMVMTPAVVTPAVVNRFELAQELAIQVLCNLSSQPHAGYTC